MTKHLFITVRGNLYTIAQLSPTRMRECVAGRQCGNPRVTVRLATDNYFLIIVLRVSLSRDSSQHSISILVSAWLGSLTLTLLLHTLLKVAIFTVSGTSCG